MTRCRMWSRLVAAVIGTTLLGMAAASPARASSTSLIGTFVFDNDVVLYNFTVLEQSNVTLQTFSYGGGVNAAGDVIPAGGFDAVLSLFDSSGALITYDDDGVGNVDPVTGVAYDAFIGITLGVGTYTVALTQFSNFATGNNLSGGFAFDGISNINFTLAFAPQGGSGFFWDVTETQRTGNWAMDVTVTPVPEPSSVVMAVAALAIGLGGYRLRRDGRTIA